MNSVFLGIAVLVGAMVLLQGFVSANPATLAVTLKRAAGAGLMAFAVIMAVTGRFVVAIPLFVFALMLAGPTAGRYAQWVKPFLGPWGALLSAFGGGAKATGRRSSRRRCSRRPAASAVSKCSSSTTAARGNAGRAGGSRRPRRWGG
jgi:hypothetical protein